MLLFHAVKSAVGGIHQSFCAVTVTRVHSETSAQGDGRLLAVIHHTIADAAQHLLRALIRCFREDQCELVTSVPCGSVDRAGVKTNDIRGSAQCTGSNLVPKLVVNQLKAVQVKQQESERSTAP